MSNIATPSQLANLILAITIGKRNEYHLTPYKLGKMVYVVYAWYYAITDTKLFTSPIQIGQNGPVIKEVDAQFAEHKNNIIPSGSKASTYDVDSGIDIGNLQQSNPEHLKVMNLTAKILEFYKDYDDTKIKDLTHEKGSLWEVETDGGKNCIDQNVTQFDAMKNRALSAMDKYTARYVGK
jgi:uncharacterized phage-associated protein